jgi:hypothetical protein
VLLLRILKKRDPFYLKEWAVNISIAMGKTRPNNSVFGTAAENADT